jgi:hypothetical protein
MAVDRDKGREGKAEPGTENEIKAERRTQTETEAVA